MGLQLLWISDDSYRRSPFLSAAGRTTAGKWARSTATPATIGFLSGNLVSGPSVSVHCGTRPFTLFSRNWKLETGSPYAETDPLLSAPAIITIEVLLTVDILPFGGGSTLFFVQVGVTPYDPSRTSADGSTPKPKPEVEAADPASPVVLPGEPAFEVPW